MRYVLAAILVCAIGAPAAYALPTAGANAVSISTAAPIVQTGAKRKAPPPAPAKSSKKSGGSSNASSGIHPLVGSGEY
ncbi:MAG: hypothetical protein CTY15_09625 [Methylocystis sp.]|nr:MAG: hypothetical protein CTY15_09625 [Methylocystis sp.]